MEDYLKMIISGIIAYYLPKILKSTDITKTKNPWFVWVIASFVGGTVGGIASGLLVIAGTAKLDNLGFGNWASIGTCLGLGQQIALRGYLPVTGWWAVASTVGWALFPLGGPIGGPVIAGLSVGVLQALSLRDVSGKRWWIGGNLLVWPLVAVFSLAIARPVHDAVGTGWDWVVAWGLAGMFGAILLVYPLIRLAPAHPAPQPRSIHAAAS